MIERAKAYFDGISESKTVCAIKHFPGDGVDERDQHVVTSWNTLGVDDWHASYGRVYRALIDHGVQSIMAGHIGAPELSRKLRPGIAGFFEINGRWGRKSDPKKQKCQHGCGILH